MRRVWGVVVGLGLVVAACGSGGGGAARTATPTRTQTPRASPTRTVTPAANVAVSSVFPSIGNGGGGVAVLIEGAGFSGAGINRITFGDAAATSVVTLSDQQISCLSPAGASGEVVAVTVTNDKGSGSLGDGFRYGGSDSPDELFLEILSEPALSFDSDIGTTTVVVDYLVRDSSGTPLDDTELNVAMFIGGEQLGAGRFGESILDRDSEELDLSVLVTMVLDASFSLQQFDPPQFAPMLSGAQSLVDTGLDIWRNRGGTFNWEVVWFDELISTPAPDSRTFRIGNIPVPQPGSFTKLYSATSAALDVSATRYAEGVANTERDRHVVVVFTDGLDNLSSFDNPGVRQEGMLRNGDLYPRFGWPATGLDDVLSQIAGHPAYPTNLTVHTIALGKSCETAAPTEACFDEPALGEIAQVGFGQRIVSARSVTSLFDLIKREFSTLQSSGAVMALPPGLYEFRLFTERKNQRANGEVRFRFRVRPDGADFVSF